MKQIMSSEEIQQLRAKGSHNVVEFHNGKYYDMTPRGIKKLQGNWLVELSAAELVLHGRIAENMKP